MANTLGSDKGGSSSLRLNQVVSNQFSEFYKCRYIFSLGVGKEGQLRVLLGRVPIPDIRSFLCQIRGIICITHVLKSPKPRVFLSRGITTNTSTDFLLQLLLFSRGVAMELIQ